MSTDGQGGWHPMMKTWKDREARGPQPPGISNIIHDNSETTVEKLDGWQFDPGAALSPSASPQAPASALPSPGIISDLDPRETEPSSATGRWESVKEKIESIPVLREAADGLRIGIDVFKDDAEQARADQRRQARKDKIRQARPSAGGEPQEEGRQGQGDSSNTGGTSRYGTVGKWVSDTLGRRKGRATVARQLEGEV